MPSQASFSPKLKARAKGSAFYRYYAGYSTEFALWALQKLDLGPNACILDPWIGSGTTALACVELGHSGVGYDISPVMVHLARARIANNEDIQIAMDLVDTVRRHVEEREEILLTCLSNRLGQFAIKTSRAASVAIASLFPIARRAACQARTKNPAWFSRKTNIESTSVNTSATIEEWKGNIRSLESWRAESKNGRQSCFEVVSGDSRILTARPAQFDGVLTSPPYLTRLDYVHATLPELQILRHFEDCPDVQQLRSSMIGTPLTSGRTTPQIQVLPLGVRDTLRAIQNHPSKASSTYYLRFFSTYFFDLMNSIRHVSRSLKSGGMACFVVQSSSYKDIHVDLASAVIEIGAQFELLAVEAVEFASSRSMSLINTRAHQSARKPKCETAVFMRRC